GPAGASMPTSSTTSSANAPPLTALYHGGGCGCKISPGVLAELLRESASAAPFARLLVGTETGDDAAVYQLSDDQAVVATTDFFMPIVDDPFDFGRIAAANALSDIYAMGAKPLLALALLAMPVKVLPPPVIRRIIRGGEAICAEAGIPIAGGHSIDSVEPIYGLAAIGVVHPRHLKRNSEAREGDALILGKPLGVGILSAALRKGQLTASGYQALIGTTTRLNRAGPELAAIPAVHAMTDVTGFGLLGHLLGMCRGARLGARVSMARTPLLDDVLAMAGAGCVTGASARNWDSYEAEVRLAPELGAAHRALLCDPQTSGGLLVACAPDAVGDLTAVIRLPNILLAVLNGVLIDRFGPARIILWTAVTGFAGAVLTAIGTPYELMWCGRLVFGISEGAIFIALVAGVAQWFSRREIALATAIFLSLARVGSFTLDVSPTWARPLYDAGWQPPLWLGAAITGGGLVSALLFRALDARHVRDTPAPAVTDERVSWSAIWTFDVSFWYILGLHVLYAAVFFPFRQTYAIEYLQHVKGLALQQAGNVNSGVFAAAIFATPLFGLLADRVGHRALMLTFGTLLLPITFIVLGLTDLNPWISTV